jgi:hypothetical protein
MFLLGLIIGLITGIFLMAILFSGKDKDKDVL